MEVGSLFERKCPNPDGNPRCRRTMFYVQARSMRAAEAAGGLCRSCGNFGERNGFFGKSYVVTEAHRRKISAGVRAADLTGSRNSMFGRKHTDEARCKMSLAKKGRRKSLKTRARMAEAMTPERRLWYSKINSGINNPMHGRVGAMKGKTHTKEARQKISAALSGRLPIQGSRGICGVYRGINFRSSSELNYLLKNDTAEICSAEAREYRVAYVDTVGKRRYYYPDFFVEQRLELIEIKPPNNWLSYQLDAPAKMAAARIMCRRRGWKYKVVEIPSMPQHAVFCLRRQGLVKLTMKWERRYVDWLKKETEIL